MESLLAYVTGFGLASGAGSKACIPVFVLSIFHFTPYFEFSERWVWIASPPVMIVLGVIAVAEILVDASPTLGEYADKVSYLPKITAGFIALSAATGTVDTNLIKLGASGILGGATAGATAYLRNKLREKFRDTIEEIHEGVGKVTSIGEVGITGALSATAIVVPLLVLFMLVGLFLVGILIYRHIEGRRIPCIHCGEPIRPGALVCPHCRREQVKPQMPVQH